MKRLQWIKLTSLVALISLMSCSSNEKEMMEVDHTDTIKRDYVVTDASSLVRPVWVEDAGEWAKRNNYDTNKNRYFSFHTSPKGNREIACQLAKANARADIAQEISTFVNKSLGQYQEGQASVDEMNPQVAAMREFVEVSLAEKTNTQLSGASVLQTYWEKRNYKQDLGAKRDFLAYTCSALIEIPRQSIEDAINRVKRNLDAQSFDTSLKEKVKKALDEIPTKFL